MPAELKIEQLSDSNRFVLYKIYHDEPKANSYDTLMISGDGTMLNNRPVKSNLKLSNLITEIITEYESTDGNNNDRALIRHIFTFDEKNFTISKYVLFDGRDEWIKRHEYMFLRNAVKIKVSDIQ